MSFSVADKHVAVLMGGLSSEREVSLVSGGACADALERLGARVTRVDAGRDLAAVLTTLKPDVCFNALHGEWGEDGCVQGVLETLGLRYTHCGVLPSALAMDKAKAKAVLAAAGVVVPGGGLFNRHEAAREHVMPPPYVVKPNAEGSSVGVFLVFDGANRPPQELSQPSWTFGEEVMIEPYIDGYELAVAVMDGKALAVTEIVPKTGFYDFEAKYGDGGSEHVLPARISDAAAQKAMALAELAHRALGCRGVTRSDFRYDSVKDNLVLLEVNTQPGMTPTSLAPEQAAHKGISFDQLVLWIVEDAYGRGGSGQQSRGKAPPRAPAGQSRRAAAPTSKLRGAQPGVGLPPKVAVMAAGGAVVLAVGIALFTGDRLSALGAAMGRGMASELAAVGFRLTSLKIVGASPMAAADIARVSGLAKDQPIANIDLAALRERIRAAGWVEEASVSRLWPSTIVVRVKQRTPVAVWQSNGVMRVVDATGRPIPEAAPGSFPDLPLLVGQGANTTESSVLGLIKSRPRLAQRLDALVRVDERRWDLRLKDGAIIQLPAVGEEEALIQLDKLDASQRLLDLGFERIDLRSSDMVVVRRRDAAPILAAPALAPVPAVVQ